MTETQVGHLYKAASVVQQVEKNNVHTLLRSYYLMRCKEITKGHGLPEKHFSSKVRCSKCCIEWTKGTKTKVKSIKLSKKQRQRIRALKSNKDNKDLVKSKLELLNSKEIEQICTVCKKSTVMLNPKPEKLKPVGKKLVQIDTITDTKKIIDNSSKPLQSLKKAELKKSKELKNQKAQKNKIISVYNKSLEVFTLNNEKNTITNSQKEEKKEIKNNKKRKDKFAGLCQKAVLATAKLKEEKTKQNKLNLFLKPSK